MPPRMSDGWEACVRDARQGSLQKRDRRFGVKLFPLKTGLRLECGVFLYWKVTFTGQTMHQTYACITLKFGLLLPFKYIIHASVSLFSTSFVENSQLAAWSKKWILHDRLWLAVPGVWNLSPSSH